MEGEPLLHEKFAERNTNRAQAPIYSVDINYYPRIYVYRYYIYRMGIGSGVRVANPM
jgi:hypothetical protein